MKIHIPLLSQKILSMQYIQHQYSHIDIYNGIIINQIHCTNHGKITKNSNTVIGIGSKNCDYDSVCTLHLISSEKAIIYVMVFQTNITTKSGKGSKGCKRGKGDKGDDNGRTHTEWMQCDLFFFSSSSFRYDCDCYCLHTRDQSTRVVATWSMCLFVCFDVFRCYSSSYFC